jgi:hypothetical protein
MDFNPTVLLTSSPNTMSQNLRDQIAVFSWNGKAYDVEVCGFIVASLRTIAEVKAFCAMHHSQF